MSWEHVTVAIRCECGFEGSRTTSSDDWGRSEESFSGFTQVSASDYERARKHADYRIQCPQCKEFDKYKPFGERIIS